MLKKALPSPGGAFDIKKIKEATSMAKKKIYLSPSNQNANIYAYGNTNEMEQCNRIADYAKTALERCGFSVKKAPKGQDMYKTIAESDNWGADLHIPIHTNAANGKTTGGTLVMLFSNTKANNKAGNAILSAVAPLSPGKDYALWYRPGLAELNSTKAIATYLEVEFHDTKEGAKWIINNAQAIGEAIAKGVCNYYGKKYKAPTEENSSKVYRVQVGAYSSKANAEAMLKKVKAAGFKDAIIAS